MKRLLLTVIFLFSLVPAQALEYWTRYYPETVPWQQTPLPLAVGNDVYVIGIKKGTTDWGMWRSSDGKTWTEIPLPANFGVPYSGEQLNGSLFILSYKTTGYMDRTVHLHRLTPQPDTWQSVQLGSSTSIFVSMPLLTALTSFNGRLYTAFPDGTLYSTDGQGSSLTFDAVPLQGIEAPPSTQAGQTRFFQFFVYKGKLHVASFFFALNWATGNSYTARIYRQISGPSYELLGEKHLPISIIQPISPFPSMCVYKDQVILAMQAVWTAPLNGQGPLTWNEFSVPGTQPFYPSVIFDRLFVFRPQGPVVKYNDNGTWSDSFLDRSPTYGYAVAQSGNTAYIASDNLLSISKGGLSLTLSPTPETTLYPGARSITVLQLQAKVNLSDRIKLTVKNIGTADSNSAIESVKLLRNPADVQQTTIQAEGVFKSQSPDGKTWTMDNFVDAKDGDIFYVAVDVKANAPLGQTCILSVDQTGVQFENNPGFTLPAPLVSPRAFTIQSGPAPAAQLGDEILVYPAPAKDLARFTYDLSSPSDILIRIYNESGSLVSEITDPGKSAGTRQETLWNCANMAPGVYFAVIKITGAGERIIKKKVYIKR